MKRLPLVLPLLLLGAACADDTFAVVSVLTRSGSIDGIERLRVHVTNGSSEDVLSYPNTVPRSFRLDGDQAVTFSVEFPSWAGQATIEVEPLARDGTVRAYGWTSASIRRHVVSPVAIRVVAGAVRPSHPPSSGSGSMLCDPTAPADACGPERTCGVFCASDSAPVSLCYSAGSRAPGETCASNNDCGPGAQCLTYSAESCNIMTCVKFCEDDLACDDGNGSCNVSIECGGSGSFNACSRPCDPTIATGNGCAAGLGCFVSAGDRTDCACPGLGAVGASCTQNSGCTGGSMCSSCSAGLSCVMPTGAGASNAIGVCRPVCRLADRACPSGTTCRAFDNSSKGLYGFCK